MLSASRAALGTVTVSNPGKCCCHLPISHPTLLPARFPLPSQRRRRTRTSTRLKEGRAVVGRNLVLE